MLNFLPACGSIWKQQEGGEFEIYACNTLLLGSPLHPSLLTIHFRLWASEQKNHWDGRITKDAWNGKASLSSWTQISNEKTCTFCVVLVRFKYSSCIKWNKTCVVVSLKAVCIRVYVKNPFCETFILFQMVATTPLQWMDMHAVPSPCCNFYINLLRPIYL